MNHKNLWYIIANDYHLNDMEIDKGEIMTVGTKHKHATHIVLKASAICKKVHKGESRKAIAILEKQGKTDGGHMSPLG